MGVKKILLNPYVLLAAVCILTRIPFASQTLYHWDSVQFALALHHFDVTLHQPQPPGYILYVAIGKVFRHCIADDNSALVSMSIFFSAASALALYALMNLFAGKKTSFLATLLFLSSPLVWFHGEVAFSYIVEGFFSTVTAYHCILFARNKNANHLTLSTFFLGISGGVRQNTLLLLLPLWMYTMLCGLCGDKSKNVTKLTKHVLLQLSFLLVVFLSWFIPMIFLSGGYLEYASALHGQSSAVIRAFSVFGGGLKALLHNAAFVLYTLFCALTVSLFLLLCYAYFLVKNSPARGGSAFGGKLILFWLLPSLLFYLLIHINNPGYIFTFLPALFVVLAKSLEWLKNSAKNMFYKTILAFFFAGNVFFFFAPSAVQTSYNEIFTHDVILNGLVKQIRYNFSPEETVILSFNHFYYGFRHAMAYLPEYTSYEVSPEAGYNRGKFLGGDEYRFKNFKTITLPDAAKYVVLFADSKAPFAQIEKTLSENKTLYDALRRRYTLKQAGTGVNIVPRAGHIPVSTALSIHYDLHWYEKK